jgi:outer membrane lipoprotein LolB
MSVKLRPIKKNSFHRLDYGLSRLVLLMAVFSTPTYGQSHEGQSHQGWHEWMGRVSMQYCDRQAGCDPEAQWMDGEGRDAMGQRISGTVQWQVDAAGDWQIQFRSPLGQTVAALSIQRPLTTDVTTHIQVQQYEWVGGSVESVMQQALGFSMPLSALWYWLQGELAPSPAVLPEMGIMTFTQASQPATFEQAGWQGSYRWRTPTNTQKNAQNQLQHLQLNYRDAERRLQMRIVVDRQIKKATTVEDVSSGAPVM